MRPLSRRRRKRWWKHAASAASRKDRDGVGRGCRGEGEDVVSGGGWTSTLRACRRESIACGERTASWPCLHRASPVNYSRLQGKSGNKKFFRGGASTSMPATVANRRQQTTASIRSRDYAGTDRSRAQSLLARPEATAFKFHARETPQRRTGSSIRPRPFLRILQPLRRHQRVSLAGCSRSDFRKLGITG